MCVHGAHTHVHVPWHVCGGLLRERQSLQSVTRFLKVPEATLLDRIASVVHPMRVGTCWLGMEVPHGHQASPGTQGIYRAPGQMQEATLLKQGWEKNPGAIGMRS